MKNYTTNYFSYTDLVKELEDKRKAGEANDDIESVYADRLDRIWNRMTVHERRWVDPPKVTLCEALKDFDALRDLEEIEEDGQEFKMLWHHSYYDGPLSGVAMFREREHWFQCVLEGEVARAMDGHFIGGRVFAIVELTDEQIKELYTRHEAFERHVGTHTTYKYEGRKADRELGAVNPQKDWDKFYDEYKDKHLDFSANRAIAWYGRVTFNHSDLLYDILPYEKAREKMVPKEDRDRDEASRKKWDDDFEEYKRTDPLFLAMLEGVKDPVFSPTEGVSIGVCYHGWCKDFDEPESRICRRIAYRSPHTVDLEWAKKTGPIKISIYREGSKHEERFFWGHSANDMREALEYAKAVLRS